MIDSEELRRAIVAAGVKYGHLAKHLGITPYSLQKKIDNITEFKASEIRKICDVLNLSKELRDDIFFAA